MPAAARTMTPEKSSTLIRQHHIARLAGLGLPDRQRGGIRIEIADLEPDQLAVPASGFQPGAHQRAEFWIARVDQPLRLRDC